MYMFKYFLFIFLNLFLSILAIQGSKRPSFSFENFNDDQSVEEPGKSTRDNEPIFFDSTNDHVEEELDEAISDDDHQLMSMTGSQLDEEIEQRLMDLTGGSLEDELAEATKDDAHVPSSANKSSINHFDSDSFIELSLSKSSLSDIDHELEHFPLDRVPTDKIPSGITVQDYPISDKVKLIELYQSTRIEDTKELFQFIAQHIHNKYTNCVSNFGKWIRNPRSGEPIFYRNCVPCTNAVDLNLQSLFNQEIHLSKLEHYFVNTCDMGNQWISYISDMEYLPVDLKRHPTTTFTDVIRQNLLPNHRYVFQGIVRSERGKNHKGFFHVCNLVNNEYGHLWIIDGQIQRLFDLDKAEDIKELDQRYRPDYVARASTGLFKPSNSGQFL